ncbi:hypothetical protein KX816_05245 [Sphingosinicellaceae bacterium]|nr:hypothetical protein KX816_05245 [Sphingosinicellaceae bacterium]
MTIAVNMAVGPTIMLQSGEWFDILDPRGSTFTIEDIAHGLANTCRYAGQCKEFYSVAEHSLHVSATCTTAPFEALMHDAAEAFIGDVTRPLKQLLPEYKAIEHDIEQAVFERFSLPPILSPEVKQADLRVLAAEQAQIMAPSTSDWAKTSNIYPATIRVEFMPPKAAKKAFLKRFAELSALREAVAPFSRMQGILALEVVTASYAKRSEREASHE